MRAEVPSRVEMQEKKRTRGDRERGMQGDMPGTQCRRGRQQGTGKGDRREKASVILKLELSAWETQGLRWKWAPGFQVDRKELAP